MNRGNEESERWALSPSFLPVHRLKALTLVFFGPSAVGLLKICRSSFFGLLLLRRNLFSALKKVIFTPESLDCVLFQILSSPSLS